MSILLQLAQVPTRRRNNHQDLDLEDNPTNRHLMEVKWVLRIKTPKTPVYHQHNNYRHLDLNHLTKYNLLAYKVAEVILNLMFLHGLVRLQTIILLKAIKVKLPLLAPAVAGAA